MPVLVQFEGEGKKNCRDPKKNVYRSGFAFIQHIFIQILLGLSEVTAPWQVTTHQQVATDGPTLPHPHVWVHLKVQ